MRPAGPYCAVPADAELQSIFAVKPEVGLDYFGYLYPGQISNNPYLLPRGDTPPGEIRAERSEDGAFAVCRRPSTAAPRFASGACVLPAAKKGLDPQRLGP